MSTVPIITAAADLPFALRRAERYVESRSYVAQRAHELGLGELVPASWDIPVPSARTKTEAPVSNITAAGWNPNLHPRGRDGKFIELHGLLNLFDGTGFDKPSLRAEAIGVRKEGGNDILTVRAKSVGKFGGKARAVGDEFDVPAQMAEAAPDPKGKLTHPVFTGKVKPQGPPIKGEATDLKKAQDRADAAAKELADAEASGDKARITKARAANTAAQKNLDKQQGLEDQAGEDLTSQLEQSVAQLGKPDAPGPDAPAGWPDGIAEDIDTLNATGIDDDEIRDITSDLDPEDVSPLDVFSEAVINRTSDDFELPDPDEFDTDAFIDDRWEQFEAGASGPPNVDEVARDLEAAVAEALGGGGPDEDPEFADGDTLDAKAAGREYAIKEMSGEDPGERHDDDPDWVAGHEAGLKEMSGVPDAKPSSEEQDYNTGFEGGDYEPTTEWEPGDDPISDPAEYARHILMEGAAYEDVLNEDGDSDPQMVGYIRDLQAALDGDVGDPNVQRELETRANDLRGHLVDEEYSEDAELPTFRGPDSSPSFPDEPASIDDIPSGMTPQQKAADQWENDYHDYLEGLPEDARSEIESAIADEDWQGALDAMDANYEYGHGNAIDEFREKVVNKEAYDVSQKDMADTAYTDLVDALGENPELSTDEIGRELMDRGHTPDAVDAAIARHEAENGPGTTLGQPGSSYADNPIGTKLTSKTGNPAEDIQREPDGNWYDGNGIVVDPASINHLDYEAPTGKPAPTEADVTDQFAAENPTPTTDLFESPDPEIQSAFDKWTEEARAAGMSDEQIAQRVEYAQSWEPSWKASTPGEARTAGKSNAEYGMSRDRLVAFPVGDPGKIGFGGYEIWHTNPDGSKNGGRGHFKTKEAADAFIEASNAEYDRKLQERLDTVPGKTKEWASGKDPFTVQQAKLNLEAAMVEMDPQNPDDMDQLKVMQARIAAMDEILAKAPAPKADDLPDDAPDIPSGAQVEAGPAAKVATPGASPQRAAIELSLGNSASNKGFEPGDLDAVFSAATPEDAHKAMAAEMTRLKLGGKQRKRLRELLDLHFGNDSGDSAAVQAKATADALPDDNELKSRLAAKAAAPKVDAPEAGSVVKTYADVKAGDSIRIGKDWVTVKDTRVDPKSERHILTLVDADGDEFERDTDGLLSVNVREGAKQGKDAMGSAPAKPSKPGLEAIGDTFDQNAAQAAINEIDAIRGPGATFLPKDVDNDLADATRYLNYTAGGESNGTFDLASDRKVAIESLQQAYNKLPAGPNADRVYELLQKLRGTGEPGKA